jgi:phosphopantothenoylcysteine decarboxylase/phosphopantothenate--cysteine ligase
LLEADTIVAELAALRQRQASASGALAGARVLVSAGPTFEDIDPVRFLGNRSSGRMGFAVAQAAAEAGASVQLVAGPVHLPTPPGVARSDVRSAREMRAMVMQHIPQCDIFISAAAVGDYRPAEIAAHKLKKTGTALALTLTENPDILAEVAALKKRPFLVGFAAETQNLHTYARAKLERKKLDLIAANRVDGNCGFDAADNELLLLWPGGEEALARAAKPDLARALVKRIAVLRKTAPARNKPKDGKR